MGLIFGSVLKHAVVLVTDNQGDVLFCIKTLIRNYTGIGIIYSGLGCLSNECMHTRCLRELPFSLN